MAKTTSRYWDREFLDLKEKTLRSTKFERANGTTVVVTKIFRYQSFEDEREVCLEYHIEGKTGEYTICFSQHKQSRSTYMAIGSVNPAFNYEMKKIIEKVGWFDWLMWKKRAK